MSNLEKPAGGAFLGSGHQLCQGQQPNSKSSLEPPLNGALGWIPVVPTACSSSSLWLGRRKPSTFVRYYSIFQKPGACGIQN